MEITRYYSFSVRRFKFNPAYTSQECSKCHFISPLNRIKQEGFKCTNKNCHHEINADSNPALNIKSRVLNKELRAKLNKDNIYLCSRPKPIYYRNVKTIITDIFKDSYNYEVYKIGVITELLPENMVSHIQSKEASPQGGVIHENLVNNSFHFESENVKRDLKKLRNFEINNIPVNVVLSQ